ncbi:MAG: efflux RND transporter periplasmic adaptor subunit [Chloroflexi bacterium]|nr:efflux RND transporter periplasmic adaptor subunit [Chloroflexota bacterium]
MKRQRKRILLLLVVLAVAVATLGLWWLHGRDSDPSKPGDTTAKVARRDFASTVLATGAVKPQVGAEVRVGARISGKVERLHANIGDVVKKGQVLAELEKVDLSATVRQREAELAEATKRLDAEKREGPLRIHHAGSLLAQAKAEQEVAAVKLGAAERVGAVQVAEAEAEVTRSAATLDLTEKQLERAKALHSKGIESRDTLDKAQESAATTGAQLSVARKRLELAKVRQEEDLKEAKSALAKAATTCQVAERALSLERAGHEEALKQIETAVARTQAALDYTGVQLSYATLTAPIAGVIGTVTTQEGETVAAGLSAPTFVTIIDLNRLQVDAFVDEVDIGKVRPGQKATFTVDAFPAREFEGKVVAIYPKAVIQENVVNYDVVVEITGKYDGLLRPEMTASVTIQLDARDNVLAVPAKAVKRERGKSVVYLVENGQARPREVKVGWKDSQWIEVVSGLEEGQAVLLEAPAGQPNGNREAKQ